MMDYIKQHPTHWRESNKMQWKALVIATVSPMPSPVFYLLMNRNYVTTRMYLNYIIINLIETQESLGTVLRNFFLICVFRYIVKKTLAFKIILVFQEITERVAVQLFKFGKCQRSNERDRVKLEVCMCVCLLHMVM
jgi:hypothetical protein